MLRHPRRRPRAVIPAALLAASVLALSLGTSATHAQRSSASPHRGGTITIAFSGNMATFDPAQAYYDDWQIMNGTLFNGLYQFDRNGQPRLDLAAAPPTISADRKTWTFKIRTGVRFSNGMQLTAEDVAFSLQRVLDPHLKPSVSWGQSAAAVYQGSAAYMAGKAKSVSGIQVLDRYTIRLVLNAPLAVFPDILATSNNLVVPKAMLTREGSVYFANHPLGSGPYMLKSWTKGSDLIFVRNPYYFRAGRPYLDKLVVEEDVAPNVIALKVEKGEVTGFGAASEVAAADLQRFRADTKLATYLRTTPIVDVRWINLNVRVAPLNKPSIRQAIAMAINRMRLVQLMGGLAVRATQFFVPLDQQHDPSLDNRPVYAYDPTKAAALVKAGGYNGQPITVLYSNNVPYEVAMAPGVQQDLHQIGLNVSLRGVTDSQIIALAGPLTGHQISFDGWSVDFPDAYDLYNGVLQCSNNVVGGTQAAHFCDPAADAIVTRAEALPFGPDRNALYHRAQLLHLRSAARVPLVFLKETEIVSPKLGGFYYQPMFGWQPENYWLAS